MAKRVWSVLFVVLVAILLHLFSRYAAAPVTDFVLDDWTDLETARSMPSCGSIWKWSLHEADRPLALAMIHSSFHLFDNRPELFAALSAFWTTLILLTICALAYLLTGNLLTTFLTTVLFAALPNLTWSFQWIHHVTIAYMLWAYVASALCWVLYLRSERKGYLFLSAILYLIGLATYEVGVLLPVAFVALQPSHQRRRIMLTMSLFVTALALYLCWRWGILFGPKEHIVNGRDYLQGSLSLSLIWWNSKEVLRWWMGGHMFTCLREGLNGFAEMSPWHQRALFVGDLLMVALVWRILGWLSAWKTTPSTSCFSSKHVLWFGVLWVAAAHATNLLSGAGARLNLLPGIGVCLITAHLLSGFTLKTWRPLLMPALLICLITNQGTNYSWKEAGDFMRRLNNFLISHSAEWHDREVVLFDTATLRHRTTPGLSSQIGNDPTTWAQYRNAGLMRGFSLNSMLRMARPDKPAVISILDVEHDARIENSELIWHDRYDPSKPHRTPLDKVCRVDCFAAGSGQEK